MPINRTCFADVTASVDRRSGLASAGSRTRQLRAGRFLDSLGDSAFLVKECGFHRNSSAARTEVLAADNRPCLPPPATCQRRPPTTNDRRAPLNLPDRSALF